MDASLHPVRAYRFARKPPVTLGDLARRLRTTKANLSRIETGKQELSVDMLPKLMAATGIAARDLRPDLAKLFEAPRARSRKRKTA